jgi:hypothetical protein
VFPGTTADIETRYLRPAMVIVAVGILGFTAGLALAGRTWRSVHAGAAADGVATAGRRFAVRPVTALGIALLTIGAILAATYYVNLLGYRVLFTTRLERGDAEDALGLTSASLALLKAVATLPLLVSFAALMRLRAQRRAAGRGLPLILPLLVLGLLGLVVNPFVSPRYVFGTALGSVLLCFGIAATRHRVRVFSLLLAVSLVLVFPYADARRSTEDFDLSTQPGPVESLSTADFDAFCQIVNAVDFVHARGHTDGEQLVGAVLFWVPRQLWPDKPVDTGILLADYRGYSFTNLSAPLWAELFIDGGWMLLLVGMAALGFALRRLDDQAVRTLMRGSALPGGVLISVLPFYLVIMLRGSLLQSMAGATVLVGSSLLVSGRLERTRLSRPEAGPPDPGTR